MVAGRVFGSEIPRNTSPDSPLGQARHEDVRGAQRWLESAVAHGMAEAGVVLAEQRDVGDGSAIRHAERAAGAGLVLGETDARIARKLIPLMSMSSLPSRPLGALRN